MGIQRANTAFHAEVIDMTGNRLLAATMAPLLGRIRWLFALTADRGQSVPSAPNAMIQRRVVLRMTDPDGFWREAAGLIDWYTEPETIMDVSALPFSRWFAGGELNTCHNCLDRHVDAGRGDQLALVHDSPVTQSVTRYTYAELRDVVARFAGVLRSVERAAETEHQGPARRQRLV